MNPLSRLRQLPHGDARFTHDLFFCLSYQEGQYWKAITE